MVKFLLKKEIKNEKASKIKSENEIIRTLILQNLSTREIIEKTHFNRRRINKWQAKMRNGYQPGFRKVRTPKPKINTEVDIGSLPKCFNSNIDELENENDKNFIKHCLEVIKTDKFKKSNEQERNILLKRCFVCGESDELILCSICRRIS